MKKMCFLLSIATVSLINAMHNQHAFIKYNPANKTICAEVTESFSSGEIRTRVIKRLNSTMLGYEFFAISCSIIVPQVGASWGAYTADPETVIMLKKAIVAFESDRNNKHIK